jgi:hypothetical protein
LIVTGQLLFVYNVFKTLVFKEDPLEDPLEEAAPVTTSAPAMPSTTQA